MTGHPATTDRPVVVTGASSGIGEAAALQFGALGHPVVLGARRLDRCEETAARIRAGGGTAHAIRLDLADAVSVAAFVADAEAAMGTVEILVSGAGDVLPTPVAHTDPDVFARQVEINLLGGHRLVSLVAPGMIERRRGDIVFVTSDVVRLPRPQMSSYVTSKWGLEGMARAMQMELEGSGVRASIVRPGPTLTGMGADWDPEVVGDVLKEWKRWGLVRHDGYLTADGVAAAIVTAATVPRGTHLTLIEVEPEAPVRASDEGST